MAYNTGTLVSRVQRKIRDTGYSSSEIKDYLNETQDDIFNEYRLPFMEARAHAAISDDELDDVATGITLPDNYVQAIDLMLTTDHKERLLEYKDIREIDQDYPDVDDTSLHIPSEPNLWYVYDSLLKVFPNPGTACTLSLRYYKRPVQLSLDADVPDIPSEFSEILVAGAAYRVLQVKDNYDQAGILENKYTELLQKLVMKYSQTQVGKPTIMRINRRGLGKAHF